MKHFNAGFISLVIFSLFSPECYGSFAEYFGAAPENAMIGNQTTGDPENASNNYYTPSLLAFSDKLDFSASFSIAKTDFNPISNVIIRNALNSLQAGGLETGNVNVEYSDSYTFALHAAIPVKTFGKLAVSVTAPMGAFIEANTGDPFLPEYVMYRARHKRNLVSGNFSKKITDSWAFSLGAHLGIQAATNLDTRAVPNGGGGSVEGTTANVAAKASPSLAGIVSMTKKWSKDRNNTTSLTFVQESKSSFSADASGATSNPSFPFDINVNSVLYYDPSTFRFSQTFDWDYVDLSLSAEYQIWSSYQTPIVRVTKNSGILSGSVEYEKINSRNIIVPKLGATFYASEDVSISFGGAYRPTPIEGDFSGAGNSVDTDTIILAIGGKSEIRLFSQPFALNFSAQYHKLIDKFVTKTSGREDGSAAQGKIGSPGYLVGGKILAASVGLELNI